MAKAQFIVVTRDQGFFSILHTLVKEYILRKGRAKKNILHHSRVYISQSIRGKKLRHLVIPVNSRIYVLVVRKCLNFGFVELYVLTPVILFPCF